MGGRLTQLGDYFNVRKRLWVWHGREESRMILAFLTSLMRGVGTAGAEQVWERTGVSLRTWYMGNEWGGIQEQMAGGCLGPEFWGEVCAEHESESPGRGQIVLVLVVGEAF